jgi:hypothetical protein
MLIPQGDVVYENLYTAVTDVDQLIDELRAHKVTGYCLMSFPGYKGVVLFHSEEILNGIEKVGVSQPAVRTGETAVTSFLAKAREQGRELSVYKLPEDTVIRLAAALDATPIHEKLSTELTSLARLIEVLRKEALTGYIEVIFEKNIGVANVFFSEGKIVESLFAQPDDHIIALPKNVEEIVEISEKNKALFNAYQSREVSIASKKVSDLELPVPPDVITLFGQILACLESVADQVVKTGAFEKIFKAHLPQIANQYDFFDPFVGDFQYTNKSLTYTGDVPCREFVNGMCELINASVASLLETVPKNVLLPHISRAIEPVSLTHSELIDLLHLKSCMPEIFQDYSFLREAGLDEEGKGKLLEKQVLLNLRGIENPDIGLEEILREFYRVVSLISEKYSDPNGKIMYYSNLKESQEFQEYKAAAAQLQKCDPSSLQDRNERLAFWMNVYNFLVIDGILEWDVKTDVRNTKGFFTRTGYLIGKHVFSLDDIEHGILRNNQRHPYTLFRQFSSSDPRKEFCISPLESCIHCCLACGTKSSPPLVVYLPKNLDKQLGRVVDYFLSTQAMRLDLAKQELWLDRTFYWYRKDFEEREGNLFDFVLGVVQDENTRQLLQENRKKLKIRFMEYDWNLNGE